MLVWKMRVEIQEVRNTPSESDANQTGKQYAR